MRHIGLIAVCLIRLLTQLTWGYIGDYWYYFGQSMFETYALFYALLFTIDKVVFYPILFFFAISFLNFITDINGLRFGYFTPILIGLLITFITYLWRRK